MNAPVTIKASLIVVAAGQGERLRQSLQKKGQNAVLRKAFHPLAGKPILQWTLKSLKRVQCVDEIIVVLHPEDMANKGLVMSIQSWGASRCVAGGQRRQDSVLNGLLASKDDENRVVGVHDAARPLIDPEDVRRTLTEAAELGAAILGSRVKSTVKRVDD
ncbi:MAG: 2-C-methyl-D-erythritol 4-phosphate cytidylyltransferase, partial [Planctomycetota bacterium]|nr:2-C-methyl-D-erythritol 4-phosphate cytidylyltransferase [Planctomycetota bacterium]